jgi:DNA-binding transcriptional LysR family regulator
MKIVHALNPHSYRRGSAPDRRRTVAESLTSVGAGANKPRGREADVAIRVVYDRKTLPLNLHGLKGPDLFGSVYISCDRLAAWRAGAPDPIRWIVISIHGIPDWASEGEVRTTGVPFRTTDAEAQFVAVRQGLGITTLPCFIGDADPYW